MFRRIAYTVLLVAAPGLAQEDALPASSGRDAVHLARTLGISVAEAESRMRLADRLGIFQLRVRSDPGFAGAYLEHEPKLQAVVLFKGDAAAKLKRYVSDDAFVARSVQYSLADLADTRAKAAKAFAAAGLAIVGVEQDIEANRVLVHVTDDKAARQAIAAGKLKLPDAAQLNVIEGEVAKAPQSAGPVTHFPQARYPAGTEQHALLTGKLFERGGCLRVGDANGESHLVMWPSAANLAVESGTVVVRDGTAGGKLAVGADVSLSGGAAPGLPPPGWLMQPVTANCLGPYWIASRGW